LPRCFKSETDRAVVRGMGACHGCSAGASSNAQEVFSVEAVHYRTLVRRGFGWKPDLPDFRDRVVVPNQEHRRSVLKSCDLRPKDHFPIYNQGKLGSCTANAICAAVHYDQIKQGLAAFGPSRLFVYYNERAMEGTIGEDSGATIRDGMKSLHKLGVCTEDSWPYNIDVFSDKPSDACYEAAAANRAKEYARVNQDLEEIKAVLNNGSVIAFGFIVCSSFMTPEVAMSGEMVMPQLTDEVLGGHAVLCCGYDDTREVFIIRNSWGPEWGDRGYFYMPYSYLLDQFLSRDLWTVFSVTGKLMPTEKRTF